MTNMSSMRSEHAPVLPEKSQASGLGQLDVNVIFTNSRATALALKATTALATSLNARIHIRAAFEVPFRLPLDHPQVSIAFMEKVLSDLVSELPHDGPEITGHLYLCRERIETFLRILCPNSLVVIAGQRRPWPTTESRMARRLRSGGHRVIFIRFRREK